MRLPMEGRKIILSVFQELNPLLLSNIESDLSSVTGYKINNSKVVIWTITFLYPFFFYVAPDLITIC